MTTLDLFDRIPVDRITSEARQIRFRRIALTLLAGLLWLIGWTTGKTLGGIWLALAWSMTAIRLGWTEARPTPPRS
jgi:hypothetical protein